MNRALLPVLILLAALTGGWLLWGGVGPARALPAPVEGEDSGGPSEELRARVDFDSESGPERSNVLDAEPGGQGEPPEYQRALAGLRGRLVWAGTRKPLAGIEIRVAEAWLDAVVPSLSDLVGVEKMRSPVVFRARTRTDSDGSFLLEGVHGRAMMILAIGIGTDVSAVRPVPRTPAPGELVDLGEIEIEERGIVTGRVVDDAGAAIAGARVRIAAVPRAALQFGIEHFDPEGMGLIAQGPYRVVLQLPPWLKEYDEFLPFASGRTDAEGRFSVRGAMPGAQVMVVQKDGLLPINQQVQVTPLVENEIGDVVLGEGEFLSGQFLDTDGKPAQGVRVSAGVVTPLLPFGLLKKPVAVDSEGKFEISGLPRGTLYLCYQRAPGQVWEVNGPHRGDDHVKILFGALRSGRVTLEPQNGATLGKVQFDLFIADVSAYLPGMETHVVGTKHVFRDPDAVNAWQVRNLPAGIYKVIVKAPGFAFGTGVLNLEKPDPEGRQETIELTPAPTVRFRAVDAKGAPVHAARIYWNAAAGRKSETSKRRRLTRLPVLLGKTDARGELLVDGVEVGATRFYCRHPAFALGVSTDEVRPGATISFTLGPAGQLVGEVADDGRQVNRSMTILAEPTGSLRRKFAGVLTPRLTTSLPDGSFSFASIQPGVWRVKAIPDLGSMRTPADWFRMRATKGGNAPRVEAEVLPGEETFVSLATTVAPPAGGARLVGSVRINGKPAVGAWVQTWGARRRADVGEDGTFVLDGLKDGTPWVGVERRGHEGMLPNRLFEGRVEIAGGHGTLHVDVQVGDVEVTVVDAAGEPVPNLPIELRGATLRQAALNAQRGAVRIAMTTDGAGVARFAAAPAGMATVRSMMQRRPEDVIPETAVEVRPGGTAKLRIQTQPSAVTRGVVRFDDSALADPAEKAYAQARRPRYLVFASDGRFTWGPIRGGQGRSEFELRKAAPGTYRLREGGKSAGADGLRWSSDPLVIRAGGTENAVLVLRPDATQVRAVLAKLRAAEKAKGSGRSKGRQP